MSNWVEKSQGSKFHRCFVPINCDQLASRRSIRDSCMSQTNDCSLKDYVRHLQCSLLNCLGEHYIFSFTREEQALSSWTWMTTDKQQRSTFPDVSSRVFLQLCPACRGLF